MSTRGRAPDDQRPLSYHIWTVGCQMNSADSQRLAVQLERMGLGWNDDPATADVVVVNSCVVRQGAEEKVIGKLGQLQGIKRDRPDVVVGLMGCLVGPKVRPALAARFPSVDVFLPPSDPGPLVDFLHGRAMESAVQALEEAGVRARWAFQDAAEPTLTLPTQDRSAVTANIPVVYGCNWVCTFCIIPSRRGRERSREADEIVREVESLADQGIREVMLLGQIVDRYGYDRGEADALAQLLARLNEVPSLARIRFLTSHPAFMTDSLLDAVASLPKVMEHVEVPVQAGHDRTLERMKRGYSVTEYRNLVHRIRARIPGVAVHTDVIVGFCGETEAEFEATCDLAEELRFDKIHLAKFSARPGTVAAKLMADDVPEEEKERRRLKLDAIQARISGEKNAALVGETVEVLVEGRDAGRGRWRGRTRTNRLVFFEDEAACLGELVPVEVTWAGPWSMRGRRLRTERPGDLLELTAASPVAG